jgi:hypothetical protein
METVTHFVSDLNPGERSAMERPLGHRLNNHQEVTILVKETKPTEPPQQSKLTALQLGATSIKDYPTRRLMSLINPSFAIIQVDRLISEHGTRAARYRHPVRVAQAAKCSGQRECYHLSE